MATKLMNKLHRRAMKKGESHVNSGKSDAETEKFYSTLTEDVGVYKYTANPTMAWERLSVKQHHEVVTPMKPDSPITPDKLRFVCVSDTHSRTGFHDMASIPPGDVLLHAGDFTMVGQPQEVHAFNEWLGTLPHPHKLVIAGNHDLMFEESKLTSDWVFWGLNPNVVEKYLREHNVTHVRELLTNCTYLEDAETSVCGVRVYGSPWQPEFGNWAFNLRRGQDCLDKWDKIPAGVDVLMTHGPAIGHGDLCSSRMRAGCVELLHTIQKRVKPKYHVFGHIHEDPGMTTDGYTYYINASTCNLRYHPVQRPIVFDIPIPEGHSKEELANIPEIISHAGPTPDVNVNLNEEMDGVNFEDDTDGVASGYTDNVAAGYSAEGGECNVGDDVEETWETRTDWDKAENWMRDEDQEMEGTS